MPKLLIAIVHHDDAEAVDDVLRSDGHRFTRMPTIGGFLGEPNETLFLAVEDARVEEVIADLDRACSPREIEIPLVLLDHLRDWEARTVEHGGATILVADLERIVRL
jgi:uncharacterized protein YaaQ